MKRILILLLIISSYLTVSAQEVVNKVILNSDYDLELFIGKVNEEGLSNYKVFNYADEYYEEYKVKEELLNELKSLSKGVKTLVIFGSWCGDSRANVPAFQKIVNLSGMDKSKVEYIAVDVDKTGGDIIDISEYNIEYVPTFIFFKNGKEIGRIVENPEDSLEEDMLKIWKS